jgi:hypothetical protein
MYTKEQLDELGRRYEAEHKARMAALAQVRADLDALPAPPKGEMVRPDNAKKDSHYHYSYTIRCVVCGTVRRVAKPHMARFCAECSNMSAKTRRAHAEKLGRPYDAAAAEKPRAQTLAKGVTLVAGAKR